MKFGSATPPAIFSPILGALGLGLAWRRAASTIGAPDGIGELVLGAVSLLYIFAIAAYLTKLARRPGTFGEDLNIVPGRAGLAAAAIGSMLLAATMTPYAPGLARLILAVAVSAQGIIALTILNKLWNAPFAARRMNPVWQLTFVGFIVAPVAAIPLGWTGMAELILVLTLPMAVTIWIGHGLMMLDADTPPPLRPLLAIHLGPASLLGLGAVGLGYSTLALILAVWAIIIFAILFVRARYLTVAGFTPMWGAFTFPLAAFTNLMLAMWDQSPIFAWIGTAGLIAASLFIPYVLMKIAQMWTKGSLAGVTNASRV